MSLGHFLQLLLFFSGPSCIRIWFPKHAAGAVVNLVGAPLKGIGQQYLRRAWQKHDVFHNPGVDIAKLNEETQKVREKFHRNADGWNSASASLVEDSCQAPIGPRWLQSRPVSWGGPWAYGCVLCFNFVASDDSNAYLSQQGSDEDSVTDVDGGGKRKTKSTFLKHTKYVCFQNRSSPRLDNLQWHQGSGLHQAAQKHYFNLGFRLPRTRAVGASETWPILGSPTALQWAKFWQGLFNNDTARGFIKQLQLDSFVASAYGQGSAFENGICFW